MPELTKTKKDKYKAAGIPTEVNILAFSPDLLASSECMEILKFYTNYQRVLKETSFLIAHSEMQKKYKYQTETGEMFA